MKALFAVLFGYSVLVSWGSVAAMWPERHRDPTMFWFLVALAVAGSAVDAVFFVGLLGAFATWYLLLALLVQDAVFTWRLWLSVRARFRDRHDRLG